MTYICLACKSINLMHPMHEYVWARSWVDQRFLSPNEVFVFCGLCQHQMVLSRTGEARDLTKEEVQRMGEDKEFMKARADRVEHLCRVRRRGIG